jgi:hypothetical protein
MQRCGNILVLITTAVAISGCTTSKRVIDVSPSQFAAAYRLPSRYWGLQTKFHWDSRYAEIDYYRWGTRSWPEYVATWRASTATLPPGLLSETRIVFEEGPELSVRQKQILEEAMREARDAGLFAPKLFPMAPSAAGLIK